MSQKVITRFAPSPTGHFHLGGVRSALYNYLFAKQKGGTYILRSEDTDKARSKPEYEVGFLKLFEWLGLTPDKFFRQSERTEIYKECIEKMISDGFAYISKEEVKEEGQRAEVVRFKNPNKKIKFSDIILGDIEFDTTELKDFIIARSLTEPLYHLTVVVDDHKMGITHVIRGQEHISNTPRQILIQEAIGAARPLYAHMPLILGKDRAKLSKRDPEVIPALEYKSLGYLPEAIINFMALIGWNPGGEQEIFSLAELVEKFDINKIQKSGGVFNSEKLDWINKEHMKKLTDVQFVEKAKEIIDPRIRNFKNPDNDPEKELEFNNFLLEFRDSISVFYELNDLILDGVTNTSSISESQEIKGVLLKTTRESVNVLGYNDYLYPSGHPPTTQVIRLLNSLDESTRIKTKEYLTEIKKILEDIKKDDWRQRIVDREQGNLWSYALKEGDGKVGKVLGMLRLVLSGRSKSKSTYEIMEAIGQDASVARIENALKGLGLKETLLSTETKNNISTVINSYPTVGVTFTLTDLH